MVSIPFLSSLLSHIRLTCTRNSCARVFSDIPSPCRAFESDLAASLQKLSHGDIFSSDLISFNWMCKALDVVISTQASANQVLSVHHDTSSIGAADKLEMSKPTEQYMEDSVKMLDVCCLLKQALEGVNAYVKASHLALKRLQGLRLVHPGDRERAKHDLLLAKHVQERVIQLGAAVRTNVKHAESTKRLSACSSMLRRMGEKLSAPASVPRTEPLYRGEVNTDSCMVSSALYGGEICTVFFLRLLSTALSSPASCPRRSSSLMAPLNISGQAAAWVPSLVSLEAQLNSEFLQIAQSRRTQRCITLFPELHILEAAMNQIYKTLQEKSSSKQENLKHLVDSASMLTQHLQSSMVRLEHQIEVVFSSLVDIRMTMLD